MDPRPGALVRYARLASVPWHNGGGRTREVHSGAGWRLSVATIATAGEFSGFPGRDRTLVVGRGRLELAIGDRGRRSLTVGERADFPGEASVVAEPVGGPVVAVNVMTGRGRRTAAARVVRLDGVAAPAGAIVLLSGSAAVHGERLEPFDAVLSPERSVVHGAGALVLVVSLSEGQS